LEWYVSLWAYGYSKEGLLFKKLTNKKYSISSSFKKGIKEGNLFIYKELTNARARR